jgi:hypothetical protein
MNAEYLMCFVEIHTDDPHKFLNMSWTSDSFATASTMAVNDCSL